MTIDLTPALTELVSIEGEDIVIRITPDALKFGTEHCPLFERWSDATGAFVAVTVTDAAAWRDAVVRALRREQEDGTTPVHLLLDQAVFHAFEMGEDGIDAEGVSP